MNRSKGLNSTNSASISEHGGRLTLWENHGPACCPEIVLAIIFMHHSFSSVKHDRLGRGIFPIEWVHQNWWESLEWDAFEFLSVGRAVPKKPSAVFAVRIGLVLRLVYTVSFMGPENVWFLPSSKIKKNFWLTKTSNFLLISSRENL